MKFGIFKILLVQITTTFGQSRTCITFLNLVRMQGLIRSTKRQLHTCNFHHNSTLCTLQELCEHSISLHTAKMYDIYPIKLQWRWQYALATHDLIHTASTPPLDIKTHIHSSEMRYSLKEDVYISSCNPFFRGSINLYKEQSCTFLFPNKYGDSDFPTHMCLQP